MAIQPTPKNAETDLPLPISPYAAAKLSGELYCQAFAAMKAVETVTLRYFNVFGPRQDPNSEYSAVIPKFITTLLSGKPPTIFGDGKQSRDFTFVDDVVQANLRAAEANGKKCPAVFSMSPLASAMTCWIDCSSEQAIGHESATQA